MIPMWATTPARPTGTIARPGTSDSTEISIKCLSRQLRTPQWGSWDAARVPARPLPAGALRSCRIGQPHTGVVSGRARTKWARLQRHAREPALSGLIDTLGPGAPRRRCRSCSRGSYGGGKRQDKGCQSSVPAPNSPALGSGRPWSSPQDSNFVIIWRIAVSRWIQYFTPIR